MNITNLFSDIDFFCGSTSGTYLTADKLRNINLAYNDVATLIWENTGDWQFDDSNATGLPVAYSTLVHSRQDYTIPTTARKIHRIEVENKDGQWVNLKPLDWSDTDIAVPEYLSGLGMPSHYDMVGSSIILYPTPSSAYCTLASGIALYADRDVVSLTTATATPGIPATFHRLLSYAAALDFIKSPEDRQFLASQKAKMENSLKNFFSKRHINRNTAIKPKGKKQWRQYL